MLRYVKVIMFSLLLNACASAPFNAAEQPLAPTLRQWSPENSPKAVVLALHSFGDYSAAFDHVGPYFSKAGIYLEAYDQAGFGERQFDGRWAGEPQLVQEAAKRIQHLSSVYHQPVFVMGESLGGAVAILAALEQPDDVAGIILSAPAVREGIRLRYGWNVAIAGAAALAPGYRVSVERDPADPRLTPDNAERLAYDERVMRKVRMDSYWGLIQLADSASDQAPALVPAGVPVMLLYGENDRSVPEAGILALRNHLQDQLTYKTIPEGPHLLLQGKQWQATSEIILRWVEQQSVAHRKAAPRQDAISSHNAFPATSTIGPPSPLQPSVD